jgi:hypothetical protein
MLHKTAQERYEKLKKKFSRLMDRFNLDDLDDFIQTANSLPEWIRRDGTLSRDQKDALERFVVASSLDWQICHQVANAQKHVKAAHRSNKLAPEAPVVVRSVQCKPGGAGFTVPSMRVFGAGDEIVIEYDDNRASALGFVVRTFNHFRYIFEIAPIPPNQRGNPTLFASKNRSIQRSAKGDVEGALKDYDEAIRLKHRIKRRRKQNRRLAFPAG